MKNDQGTPTSPIVLVDALNVARSTWPNIRAERLVSLCEIWAEANSCSLIVVFDGSAPSDAVGNDGSTLQLIGTRSETADEWIEREAGRLATAGAPYWLVSSDRELRDLAGRQAQRTIGGGAFARELLALEEAQADQS